MTAPRPLPKLSLLALVLAACGPGMSALPDVDRVGGRPAGPGAPPPATGLSGPPAPIRLPHGSVGELVVSGPKGPEPLVQDEVVVKVEVIGRLARTELTQVFRGPEDAAAGGTFAVDLPEDAALSRVAIDVGGGGGGGGAPDEREPVPGLPASSLAPASEGLVAPRLRVRIGNVPARRRVRVVVAWESLLPSWDRTSRFTLELPDLGGRVAAPVAGSFAFLLEARDAGVLSAFGYPASIRQKGGSGTVAFQETGFVPRGPLEVTIERIDRREVTLDYGESSGERVWIADLSPNLPARRSGPPRDVVVAVDTSGSLGSSTVRQAAALAKALLAELPDGARFQVVHGSFRARACGDDMLSKTDLHWAKACLDEIDAGGATDLGSLLELAVLTALEARRPALVLALTDGVATLGDVDADRLRERLADRLGAGRLGAGDVVFHAVALGRAPDTSFLSRLARETGGRSLRLRPGAPPAAIVPRLLALFEAPLLTGLRVTAVTPNVREIVPEALDNLAPGDVVALLGRHTDHQEGRVHVSGRLDGEPWHLDVPIPVPSGAPNRLVPAFWNRITAEAPGLRGTEIRRPGTRNPTRRSGDLSALLEVGPRPAAVAPDPEALRRELGRDVVTPEEGARGLAALVRAGRDDLASALLHEWRLDPRWTPAAIFLALTSEPEVEAALPAWVFSVAAGLVDAEDRRREVLEALVRTGLSDASRRPAAADRIVLHCGREDTDLGGCEGWLRAFGDDPRAAALLPGVGARQRARLPALLAKAPSDPWLLADRARALEEDGDREGAARTLSEIVEHDPADPRPHRVYAKILLDRGLHDEACRELAGVVKVAPARREALEEALALARGVPELAPAIRRCLGDALAGLPVRRGAVLLLTWDDPSARVTMQMGGEIRGGDGVFYRDPAAVGAPGVWIGAEGTEGPFEVSVTLAAGGPASLRAVLTAIGDGVGPAARRRDVEVELRASGKPAVLRGVAPP